METAILPNHAVSHNLNTFTTRQNIIILITVYIIHVCKRLNVYLTQNQAKSCGFRFLCVYEYNTIYIYFQTKIP